MMNAYTSHVLLDGITYPYPNLIQTMIVKGVLRVFTVVIALQLLRLRRSCARDVCNSWWPNSWLNNSKQVLSNTGAHGLLTTHVKLWVANAPGMPGTFPPRHRLVSDPGMHHGTFITHVPWCMSGSLTLDGGENVPGITGARASRNFRYLTSDP